MSERRRTGVLRTRLLLSAVVLATGVLYWPGLRGPLLLDDLPVISGLFEAERHGQDLRGHLLAQTGPLGRPVAMATFAADIAVSGPDVAALKRTNLAIHLLAGLLVFLLARRLFARNGAGGDGSLPALVVGAVWLLHPLQVSTVLYTVQRMTQLASLFTLAGLLAYSHGRARQIDGRPAGGAMLLAFGVCWPLAVFSKESGVLLPLLALVCEIFVFRFRQAAPPQDRLALALLGLVASACVAGVLYGLVEFDTLILERYARREFTLAERLLTQSRVLVFYLDMIVLPRQSAMGFVHDDIVLSRGLFEPPGTAASLLIIVALLAAAFALIRRRPLVGFGVTFFFAGHLLESTVVPLEMMYEHRNYLPGLGIMIAVVALVSESALGRNIKLVAAVAAIAVLAFTTHLRVGTWSSMPALLNHMLQAHPGSYRLRDLVARMLIEDGQYAQAEVVLDGMEDDGARALLLYGRCLGTGEVPDAAIEDLARAVEPVIDIGMAMNLMDLGRAALEGRCSISDDAYLGMLEQVLPRPMLSRHDWGKLMFYKAHFLRRSGRDEQALAALDETARKSGNAVAMFLSAEWLLERGDREGARLAYARAVELARTMPVDLEAMRVRVEGLLRQAGSEEAR